MGLKVLAEESLATSTIETMATEFRIIGTNTIANFKPLDILSDCGDFTDSLMTGNQWELYISLIPLDQLLQ